MLDNQHIQRELREVINNSTKYDLTDAHLDNFLKAIKSVEARGDVSEDKINIFINGLPDAVRERYNNISRDDIVYSRMPNIKAGWLDLYSRIKTNKEVNKAIEDQIEKGVSLDKALENVFSSKSELIREIYGQYLRDARDLVRNKIEQEGWNVEMAVEHFGPEVVKKEGNQMKYISDKEIAERTEKLNIDSIIDIYKKIDNYGEAIEAKSREGVTVGNLRDRNLIAVDFKWLNDLLGDEKFLDVMENGANITGEHLESVKNKLEEVIKHQLGMLTGAKTREDKIAALRRSGVGVSDKIDDNKLDRNVSKVINKLNDALEYLGSGIQSLSLINKGRILGSGKKIARHEEFHHTLNINDPGRNTVSELIRVLDDTVKQRIRDYANSRPDKVELNKNFNKAVEEYLADVSAGIVKDDEISSLYHTIKFDKSIPDTGVQINIQGVNNQLLGEIRDRLDRILVTQRGAQQVTWTTFKSIMDQMHVNGLLGGEIRKMWENIKKNIESKKISEDVMKRILSPQSMSTILSNIQGKLKKV